MGIRCSACGMTSDNFRGFTVLDNHSEQCPIRFNSELNRQKLNLQAWIEARNDVWFEHMLKNFHKNDKDLRD
jgi:hypothetical protein